MPFVALRTGICALTIGASMPLHAAGIADQYSQVIIFGDSLSDAGDSRRAPGTAVTDDPSNVLTITGGLGVPFPPSPYFNGRFSDGPVWSDTVIAEFEAAGKTGRNYAFGGAKAVRDVSFPVDIPDFADQRNVFKFDPTVVSGPRDLAVVYFGGNDIFGAVSGNGGDVAATLAEARAAADEIGRQVMMFDQLTLNDFAIVNSGDVGATPRYSFDPLGTNSSAPLRDLAGLATEAFNDQLGLVAEELRATGRNIIEVDVASALEALLSDPAANGFIDAVTPCGIPSGFNPLGLTLYDFGQPAPFGNGTGVSATGCITEPFADLAGAPANVRNFTWFDAIHPTSVVQQRIAQTITGAIDVPSVAHVPLPLPAVLLGGGLVLLAGLRRRAA